MMTLDTGALDLVMPMHVRLDAAGRVRHVGPTLGKMFKVEELIGRHVRDVFDVRDNGLGRADSASALPHFTKLFLTLTNGAPIALKGITVPLADGSGELLNLSFGLSVVDAVAEFGLSVADFAHTDLAIEMLYLVEAKSAVLDEIKQLNLRLQGAKMAAEEQAFTDTLTGLKNRRAMDQIMARMIRGRVPFSLMHLDLDFFKSVNDTHGHAAGDAVLERVAAILVEETRHEDMVARVGGDEFILVFSRLVDHERLMRISYRIIGRLEEPMPFNDVLCRISGSIGITTSEIYETLDADQMMHDADLALYASKHAGRATATIFDPAIHAAPPQRVAVGDGMSG
ncbi:diguanylate cyclase [Celeribacter sp.]|uniref:diguanylate cyclase n=1 Tax=Celeribacter sp. TaxID=1890673 RepID=UPI003A8E2D3B